MVRSFKSPYCGKDGNDQNQQTERTGKVTVDHFGPGFFAVELLVCRGVQPPGGTTSWLYAPNWVILRRRYLPITPRPVGTAKPRISQTGIGAKDDDDKSKECGNKKKVSHIYPANKESPFVLDASGAATAIFVSCLRVGCLAGRCGWRERKLLRKTASLCLPSNLLFFLHHPVNREINGNLLQGLRRCCRGSNAQADEF